MALTDTNRWVRLRILQTLEKLGERAAAAAPHVALAISDPDEAVSEAAASVIAGILGEAAIPFLEAAARRP
ncbi:HEAT repeat domain-containing protein [Neoroseomonas lacus]|uniref:HEAT repeat domain-containing protein n=1 Tax=Neoroseomonas lacus TaxID=287609 RepID=UPI0016640BBC|nr:HEAT repeat domain-containing protein [Neoroseomonas lacus]